MPNGMEGATSGDFAWAEASDNRKALKKLQERVKSLEEEIKHIKESINRTSPQFLSKPYKATKLHSYWWKKSLEDDFNFEEGTKLLGCEFSGPGREDMSIFCIEDNTFEINAAKEHPGHIGVMLKVHEPSKGTHTVYSTVTL